MLKSMTGFGRSSFEVNSREYIIEMKSVNHKYTDINIKLPRTISFLEENIRKIILSKVIRGKFDVYVTFNDFSENAKKVIINKELAKIYIRNLKELAEEEKISSNIEVTEITKLPDVLTIQNNIEEDEISKELENVVTKAVDELIKMRIIEGQKIAEDLVKRINLIKGFVDEISKLSAGLIEEYVVKLETRIKELLRTEDVDKSRLAQEIVIYADKCSVEEEITRLNSHIIQFLDLINNSKESVGKKLDFLIQEMNRETNTIGSKANNLEITNKVVNIKTELENIREQIQNIE